MDTAIAPSKQGLETESATWAARAHGLTIVNKETYLNASHLLTSIKYFRGQVAAFWAPHLDAAMETKRKAEAARKGLADERDHMEASLVEAEGLLKGNLLAWDAQQERERIAEEQRLTAEARRQAEAVTLAAAASLELEANATGDKEMMQEAIDILAQPIEPPVVTVAKQMPRVSGVTYRDNFKAADDVNVKALAAAVASGTAPVTFLQPNMTAINAYARATKGTEHVPGVRFFNDRQIAARGSCH